MAKKVHLKKWKIKGDKVKLTYGFLSSFYVSKKDFDRAFGPIVSGERSEIKRDFKLSFWRRLCKKEKQSKSLPLLTATTSPVK